MCVGLDGLEHKEGNMIKMVGVVICGIFVGAVGMEIVRRKYPEALDKLYAKTREIASGAREAFKTGYENTAPA